MNIYKHILYNYICSCIYIYIHSYMKNFFSGNKHAAKNFNILVISLSVLHNYFDSSTKLFF